MLALCFEKTSVVRFNTALSESNSLSVKLLFKCSISDRTGLFDANSVSVGFSGKFEQLDSPSSVSDFIENSFLEDINSLILFKMHSWLACKGAFSCFLFLEVLHTPILRARRQCVAKLLASLYCHCCCLCV